VTHIVLRLVRNALDACAQRPRPQVVVWARRSELGGVVLGVDDNGWGISREFLPRIFEPFFTTKPAGQGTGLGLNVCQALVHRLGGEIRVVSEENRGASFVVVLPPVAIAPHESFSRTRTRSTSTPVETPSS
jgi:C4-dicarboxylate-specific signal transduction histidine kinase